MPITPPPTSAVTGTRIRLLSDAFAGALSLLLPTWCAGCDEPDTTLCDVCRAVLAPHPLLRTLDSGLTVVSALPFDGVAARVIRAYKEDGRTGLARPLGAALRVAMATVLAPGERVSVVPVPSSRAAMRRRGYGVAELLARRAGARPQRLLMPARAAADQRGLGRRQRADNVAGTLRAHAAAGIAVVIVDDVVTTGATLTEAARVLRAAGADVRAAATVAATPRRRFLTGTGA